MALKRLNTSFPRALMTELLELSLLVLDVELVFEVELVEAVLAAKAHASQPVGGATNP